jgi:hypothetical protein
MTPTSKKDNTFDKAREQAQGAWDKTRDAAAPAVDQAKDVGSAVADKARDAASTVGHKAEDATASVGQGIQHLGDRLRNAGPQSGVLGRATGTVADALHDTGKYLEDRNLHGMVDDLSSAIRRNPIPALLIGVGLGFLIARTLRS